MEEDMWKNLGPIDHVQTNHNPTRPTKSLHDFFSKPDNIITDHYQRSNSKPIFIDSFKASPDSSPTRNSPTTALSLSAASDHYFQPFRALNITASGSLSLESSSPFKHLERCPEKSGFHLSSGSETCKKAESFNRRLVKNRESAARSRNRKQAYAIELENEIHKMEETKAILLEDLQTLKKQLESFEAQEHELEKRGTLERSLTL